MKIEHLVVGASALGLVVAVGCSSSSGNGSPPAETVESGGSSSGATSGSSSGQGAPTEQHILCFGDFYCNQGTVCCGNLATQGAACSTGPSCPLGQTQLCMSASDCGGATCTQFTVMGIPLGTCALGGGGSSGSSGGGSSGGIDGDGGDTGGDAAGDATGDGSLGVVPDASTG